GRCGGESACRGGGSGAQRSLAAVIDRRVRGQGLAELALAMPGLLLMLMITLGIGVVMRADAGVAAVASEAARSGALAFDARQAVEDGQARASAVADGYGLTNGSL